MNSLNKIKYCRAYGIENCYENGIVLCESEVRDQDGVSKMNKLLLTHKLLKSIVEHLSSIGKKRENFTPKIIL